MSSIVVEVSCCKCKPMETGVLYSRFLTVPFSVSDQAPKGLESIEDCCNGIIYKPSTFSESHIHASIRSLKEQK